MSRDVENRGSKGDQEMAPPLDMATLGYVFAHLSERAKELRATGERIPGTAKGSFYEDRADEAECCAEEVRKMVERVAETGLREMYRPETSGGECDCAARYGARHEAGCAQTGVRR